MKKINVIVCRHKVKTNIIHYYDKAVLALESEEEAKELLCQLDDILEKEDLNELRTFMVKNTMLIPKVLQGESIPGTGLKSISFHIDQCILE